jgi:2-polyprenyl-3-methyl-5-hydroxy-6-metoxy-1,4-benzoquinol methylase
VPSAGAGFDYEGLAAGFYDDDFQRRRGVRSKWHHLKFARIRAEMGEWREHLDVGCGPGTFIGTLASGAERRSTGVDVSARQIDFARRRYGGAGRTFELTAADRLPFEGGRFDVVTSIELIEHLDPEAARSSLAECRRVLKPNGRLVLSTPNYGALWPLLERVVNRTGGVDYAEQHINPYRRRRLERELAAAGFSPVRAVGYLLAAPFAAALGWGLADWLARSEPRALTDRLGFLLLATAARHE